MVNPPVLAPASPPAGMCVGGGGGVFHSCSCTFSGPRHRPRTCSLPLGSPRLPAVGSGACGEMEDTLESKGLKGQHRSRPPLAHKGPQGPGETRAAVFIAPCLETAVLREAADWLGRLQ